MQFATSVDASEGAVSGRDHLLLFGRCSLFIKIEEFDAQYDVLSKSLFLACIENCRGTGSQMGWRFVDAISGMDVVALIDAPVERIRQF